MNGLPGVRRVRSASAISLSLVWVEFDWGTDIYRARQLVGKRMTAARDTMPPGVEPVMTPISSITGEIMLLAVSSPDKTVSDLELRAYAEFDLRNKLLAIPGVSQGSRCSGVCPGRSNAARPDRRRRSRMCRFCWKPHTVCKGVPLGPNLPQLAVLVLTPLATLGTLTGCEDKKPAAKPTTAAKADDHGHDHGPGGHDADHKDEHKSGHGGAVIALGEQTIGAFSAKATRDEGPIEAGKDAAIDVTITPAASATAKAAAVRFWIGTQDSKGSVKAKAEIEDPKDPNRWHVHAEIPSPVPAGSMLWVEIEDDKGAVTVGSFDLKK